MDASEFARRRNEMVDRQLLVRGVRAPLVLAAMRAVPRECFVPRPLRALAYRDQALPVSGGQTISQPYIVALMLEAMRLQGGEKVLEIGTGTGYAAAVLARIAGSVCSVERIGRLLRAAALRLARLGCANVQLRQGDGTLGWPDEAPFDAIVVTAGGPQVPDALRRQLATGARLVIPVGAGRDRQDLLCVTRRSADEWQTERLASVSFVPLLGEQGW